MNSRPGEKLALHDDVISKHQQKLVWQESERQKVLDEIAALVGDFPTLQAVIDAIDAPKPV